MEELTLEQKAAAYDVAIEELRNAFYNDNNRMCEEYRQAVIKVIEPIFPELKESEDEMIRKRLIRFVTNYMGDIGKKECLDWLKKQNSNIDDANKEYWRGYREGKQEVIDKYAELKDTEDEKVRKWFSNWAHQIDWSKVSYITKEQALDWLEKAATPTPQDWNDYKDKPVELWNMYVKDLANGIERGKNAVKNHPQDYGLEKQGEFKNVDNDDLATLETWENVIKENKEKWQLSDWFVKTTLLLIQKVKRIENNGSINIKGSREMLNACINALRNVGHSHLSDWLEKQGEQKTITDFSDLRTWKYIVDAVLTEKEGIGQYLDSSFTEKVAKKLQERFGNIEQKPTLSEKDKNIINGLLSLCEEAQDNFPQLSAEFSDIEELKDWLKSIEYRIK